MSSWINVDKIRYYFHVNNRYVLNKLKIVLFPFLNKVLTLRFCAMHLG